ncbi:MAG: ATP-dependent DNA ligase [candidate division WOR-3 bacterium]|nr:ATP-dependent DNA ligase [candidate division WOR-3 bacterium]
MRLKEVVLLAEKLKEISSINEKVSLLSSFFKKVDKSEGKMVIALLIGENPYGKVGLGYQSLGNLFILKEGKETVEISEIDKVLRELKRIKGKDSLYYKLNLLYHLFRKLNNKEREFLVDFLVGEIKIGANKGIVKKAIAYTFQIPEDNLDEIILKKGNFLEVIEGIFQEGRDYIEKVDFEIFVPFSPMLADIIHSIDELPKEKFACEYKIDGIRIFLHKKDKEIKIFSRHLKDITNNLFELVDYFSEIKGDFVLDGEVVLLDKENKILPFQDMMKIISRKERERYENIKPLFFDILYKNGEKLFEIPNKDRWQILKETIPENFLIERIETDDKEKIRKFYEESIKKGNEGIMIKKLSSPYFIGSRKKYWLKLKNYYTLDLIILEAEWGHGRRKGWLSNFLLGCLNNERNNFLPLGKTFKGLSDKEFDEITKILLTKKIEEREWGIVVKPEIVVEVFFSEIEKSPFYESGYALRFARINRIRYDKSPYEIATIDEIIKIFEEERRKKGEIESF